MKTFILLCAVCFVSLSSSAQQRNDLLLDLSTARSGAQLSLMFQHQSNDLRLYGGLTYQLLSRNSFGTTGVLYLRNPWTRLGGQVGLEWTLLEKNRNRLFVFAEGGLDFGDRTVLVGSGSNFELDYVPATSIRAAMGIGYEHRINGRLSFRARGGFDSGYSVSRNFSNRYSHPAPFLEMGLRLKLGK